MGDKGVIIARQQRELEELRDEIARLKENVGQNTHTVPIGNGAYYALQ